jgi:hypothetical protein
MSLTPIVACRTAIKAVIDNASPSLNVDVHDLGLPYGGARSGQVIITQVTGSMTTFGGENYEATKKGGDLIVHLQVDVWHDNPTQRDILADQIIALLDSSRASLKSSYGIFDLLLVEHHDLPDPSEGVQLYRKVLRYSMKIPVTRAS